MTEKIKLGIIGLGGICRVAHIPSYQQLDNIEIAAICDINPEKIDTCKTAFGLENVACFTDYKDLLNCDGLDFVDICTPNYLHSVIAVDALEKGLHVLCEKPDAVSVSEAQRMKDAAEKSGKQLMVIRNNRFRPTSAYLKKFIDEGRMGDIYCGRCGWQRRRGIPGKGGWFTTMEQSGGGPLIDLGVHMIDLAIWLMGNPTPVSVSGCTYTKFADSDTTDSVDSVFGEKKAEGTFDVEDLAMGFIRFDNGACLQIEFSWASNVENDGIFVELRGTKAGSVFDGNSLKIFTEENGSLVNIHPRVMDNINAHKANIEHFINVISKGADPVFTPVQGLDMIKILKAIYTSAEIGAEVKL